MTQTSGGKNFHGLREEFRSERSLPGLIAWMLIGISDFNFAISNGNSYCQSFHNQRSETRLLDRGRMGKVYRAADSQTYES